MADWQDIVSQSIAIRHRLHQQPELAWEEVETAATIRGALDTLGIPWRPCATHGTVGRLAPEAPGTHVALRADIDGLPLHEPADASPRSLVDGRMHACGHDGHTAALWAAAAWLKQHEADLPGPVSLLFQPAEEGGHGAREMIADGALEGVDEIYGWHNWPAIPFGHAVCPDGMVMSGNGTFRITLTGSGGHASQPESCRDPVLAAASLTVALQQIVSRRLPPQYAAVVNVSTLRAGGVDTIIPDTARLGGSIRFSDPSLWEPITELLRQISHDTARAHGVEALTEIFPRYGATLNHPEPAARMRHQLEAVLGPAWMFSDLPLPVMASEDFSYYLQHIPGAFALVGMGEGTEFSAPCHSPLYRFNDRVLPPVARVLAGLAGGPVAAAN